jgi:C4-dicarboxylate-binding protein DctP
MTFLKTAAMAAAMSVAATASFAESHAMGGCDDGETVVKFSHVTNTDKHPKGIAAQLLMDRINDEMNGTMCMEVFPNSTLYTDEQVVEALLRRPCRCSKASPKLTVCSTCRSCSKTSTLLTHSKHLTPVGACWT